jgi:hypothetical protein
MYAEKAQKALLPERLLGFLCFVGVGGERFCRVNMDTLELSMFRPVFGLEKMNTLEEFMFWTVFALKKMNTSHLSMVSIDISPRVQSASSRQALYDLGQCFIDRSSWTAK